MLGAFYYTMRLATRNPDVTWSRTSNPEPWQEYRNKQYKVNILKLKKTRRGRGKSINLTCTNFICGDANLEICHKVVEFQSRKIISITFRSDSSCSSTHLFATIPTSTRQHPNSTRSKELKSV